MKIYIKEQDHGVSDGAAMLRVLQNSSTPRIDLLVRESIQNSLDAGIDNLDVLVDYSIKEIDTSYFKKNFENLIYNDPEDNKVLVISDKNTTGLTGSFNYDETNMGSILKLVYNFGKPQENKGAGGSYGYGKTIYFKLGKGLVIYYTRIKLSNGNFEERIAASLVEDQNKNDSIIDYGNKKKNGIAWWGDLENGRSIPIIDQDIIERVLSSINVDRYKGNETGTRIIIPYFKEEELFEEARSSITLYDKNGNNGVSIYDDFKDYLNYSIQRWYATRLNNEKYIYGNKNNLIASINKTTINEEDQEPIFRIIKSMYNYATTNDYTDFKKLVSNSEVYIHPINISLPKSERDFITNNNVGNFVYAKLYFKDLGMDNTSDYVNPYTLLNIKNYQIPPDKNDPIIIYTRQPGMIINYNFDNVWSISNFDTPKEEYILGFFVLNSDKKTYIKTNNGNLSFEEYFREGERSDHMNWYDRTLILANHETKNFELIRRITRVINTRVKQQFQIKEEASLSSVSERVSKLLGDKIMPDLGFGKKATKRATHTTKTSNVVTSSNDFISKVYYNNIEYLGKSKIRIPFEFMFKSDKRSKVVIQMFINTESGKLNLSNYESQTGFNSPIWIDNIKIQDFPTIESIKYVIRHSRKVGGVSYLADFHGGKRIIGTLEIVYADKLYSPIIQIREEKVDE